MVLDHADPAGQHAVIQDTVDSFEHPRMLPDTSLDSGLMAGMSSPEPLEQSVLNTLWVA